MLLLTGLQGVILGDGSFHSFLGDFAVHARSLAAVPLLVWAESVCLPRLSAIARHISESGLVRPEDRGRFDHAMESTVRLRDSLQLEIAAATLAAAIVLALVFTLPPGIFPAWHRLGTGGRVSPAGWWHTLVSIPILVMLLLGWVWRLILWTRFLYLVSRLRLRLIPAHPDRAGGLIFLGISTQIFSVLAFVLGMIVAGTVANRVVHDGAAIFSFHFVMLGLVMLCLVLFVAPLLVFTGQLLETWRRGVYEYGALARSMGRQMEIRWLHGTLDASALEANDFSATTDLYALAANVYTMNVVPVRLMNMAVLAAGAILPFVPVVLMAVSPEVIVEKLTGLLF